MVLLPEEKDKVEEPSSRAVIKMKEAGRREEMKDEGL
jgi:hypothetical protein